MKKVEDSIAILNNNAQVKRDLQKPVVFKLVSNGGLAGDISQVMEIYQDGALLGRIKKDVRQGQFAKANYSVWKNVDPVVIEGIDFKYSPVAICSTGRSVFDIPVVAVVGKKEYKIKGSFDQLETLIVNTLIANKLL